MSLQTALKFTIGHHHMITGSMEYVGQVFVSDLYTATSHLPSNSTLFILIFHSFGGKTPQTIAHNIDREGREITGAFCTHI